MRYILLLGLVLLPSSALAGSASCYDHPHADIMRGYLDGCLKWQREKALLDQVELQRKQLEVQRKLLKEMRDQSPSH